MVQLVKGKQEVSCEQLYQHLLGATAAFSDQTTIENVIQLANVIGQIVCHKVEGSLESFIQTAQNIAGE